MALNEQIALYSELQRVQKRTVVQKRVQRNANYRSQVRASAASQLRSRGACNLRGRLAAFLDKAVLHRTGFHEELQGIVGQIVHAAKERSPEIRTAIRKGISADQWGAVLRVVLDSLHPYDAIAVLSEAYLIRELEDVDEKVLIGTGTRQSNMRIQAAAKEPWTYQWIRTGIARGEVLYDIGANIGAYTLIALARGARVVAFEPHHENFRELCRNVSLNELEAEATLIPLALSDGPAALRNPNFTGAAGQTMTLARSGGGPISIVAERLDELRRNMSLPLPNHIKIDVDGFELKVLQGAEETFTWPGLRTSLVEIDARAQSSDQDRHSAVCHFFNERGFATFDVTHPMARGVSHLLALRDPDIETQLSGISLKPTRAAQACALCS